MANDQPDKILIQQIKQGDEMAFRLLFDRYYKKMLIAANQILKDQSVSQDATQDVFVLLWKNRENLKDDVNIKAYLNRAAINKALTILKSRKKNISDGENALLQQVDKAKNPDDVLSQKEMKGVIHRAIDQLPEKRRVIFTMCRLQGYSHKEIAKELDISTKTIENQITQALKQLREILKSYKNSIEIILLIVNAIGVFGF